MEAQFVTSAARPEQFPAESLPEIAFLGRSNVGKSSLLNCLTGQKKLAFTSAKPGCTQLVNFYRIDGQFHFVDLPGYGYARVPKDIVFEWKQLIEQYLLHRGSLQLCFLILDARRGWMDKDLELKQWLEFHNRRYQVIATKTDKLKTQSD
jgi:GTP-binding protein